MAEMRIIKQEKAPCFTKNAIWVHFRKKKLVAEIFDRGKWRDLVNDDVIPVDPNGLVGYQFMGVATPSTKPGTPDQKVFYLALDAGTYVNFGNVKLDSDGLAILQSKNETWVANIIYYVKQTVGTSTRDIISQSGVTALFDKANSWNVDYAAISDGTFIPVQIAGNGYLDNGKIQSSSASFYSGFIKVDTNKLYRVILDKSPYDDNVAFYSSADFSTYISSAVTDEQYRFVDEIISVPDEANYMVICTRTNYIFNVESFEKKRAANVSVETSEQLLSSHVDDVLKDLMKDTDNIFNAYDDNISPLQFYVKSDGTLVDNRDKVFTSFIKIGQAKAGKYYNAKVFYDDLLSKVHNSRLIIADNGLSAGNVVKTGIDDGLKSYIHAESNADLYFYVIFKLSTESIDKKDDYLNLIKNFLMVTETDAHIYPDSYVPYQKLGLSLGKEDAGNNVVRLFMVDGNGDLLGNKIEIDTGGVAPSPSPVDSNYLNSVAQITYKLESNSISDAVVVGDGWSGSAASGYSHTEGKTEPLEFDLSQYNTGDRFILRFNCAGITSEYSDLNISVGDGVAVKTYNGTSSFTLGFIATGGNLKITPQTEFASTITDISICRISDEGQEEITLRVDNVYAQANNIITAFWNVAIGSKYSTLKNLVNGSRNIAIGQDSLREIKSGNRNVAVGTYSMPQLVEAENNVAIGADTIYPLVKAMNCVGIGKGTLGGSQSAEDCVAIGVGAMGVWSLDKDRSKCVAIGVNSGDSITDSCTHVGYRAGANVVGSRNTSIGYNSLAVGNRTSRDISGTDLTCIGSMSQIANTDEAKSATNSTAVGANTTITKSNQVIIGNSQVDEVIIGGKKIIFNSDGSCSWESA